MILTLSLFYQIHINSFFYDNLPIILVCLINCLLSIVIFIIWLKLIQSYFFLGQLNDILIIINENLEINFKQISLSILEVGLLVKKTNINYQKFKKIALLIRVVIIVRKVILTKNFNNAYPKV